MIKVLLLNDVLTKGGKERRIVELLRYCKLHYEVSFEIVFMHDGVDFPDIYETGYRIHIINWRHNFCKRKASVKLMPSQRLTIRISSIHGQV